MSKYSKEFKLKVVKYCIEQHHSYGDASEYFNIFERSTVQEWCKKYMEHGTKGLIRNKKASYSGKFKQEVIEYMHANHLSLRDTSVKYNLGNHNIVGKLERIYYEEGPQALYEERRGRSKNMISKPGKNKISKENEEDLIEEVQRLRMENAYLKKLQALVQERTKPKQEKK